MPKVVVTDLTYHAPTKLLAAATFGRSMYKLDLTDDPLLGSAPNKAVTLKLKAFPNPFRNQSRVRLRLEASGQLQLDIYDLSGRLIQNLYTGHLPAGEHDFTFFTTEKGSYVCRATLIQKGMSVRKESQQLLLSAN